MSAKLSTPSHPCELVYVGGHICNQRAFRKGINAEYRCKRHLTSKSAERFMASKEGWESLNLEQAS